MEGVPFEKFITEKYFPDKIHAPREGGDPPSSFVFLDVLSFRLQDVDTPPQDLGS